MHPSSVDVLQQIDLHHHHSFQMDHFFSIPELVELICEELGVKSVHGKDLAALARTAAVFHDAALDVLWLHQDIFCMPADLWGSQELAKSRMNLLSHYPFGSGRPVDIVQTGEIHVYCSALDLFLPDERTGAILPYLSFALITSISLGLDSFWPSILDLPLVYLALKRLEIFGTSEDPAYCQNFLTSICVQKLIQIEELIVPMLDHAACDHLSTLPALRSLRLTAWRTPDPDLFPSVPSHPAGHTGFPVLQHLTLAAQCMALGSVMEVVNGFLSTPLWNLNATADAWDAEHIIQHFFVALSTHVVHSTLEVISLHLGFKGEFLRDVARAWPNLIQLDLTPRLNVSGPPPIMTLASLRAFATHCPELSTLALTFDATAVPPSDEQPLVQKKLLALYLRSSLISSSALVGRFLTGFFPNIERIQSFSRSTGLNWQEVENVVKRGRI
ncbi:hypothetical protein C8J57DRAFT_1588071 [Mycena rebaudengoi]|nr:hypothetical protein C8J57DRAFT_1588071 [Mycena rebaudengoi]